MISVVIVGTGNVSQNLFQAFQNLKEATVIQVVGRHKKGLAYFEPYCKVSTDFDSILPSDLYVIAVSDNAIEDVSAKISFVKGLVVHTSGGTPMGILKHNKRNGVFYPLQTFTKGKQLDFKSVPICLEASNEEDLNILLELGQSLSDTVEIVSSKSRSILHLSAVFVNNFTNYLYTIGEEICEQHQLDFNLLKPLVLETAEKLSSLSTKDAQTGPARRGDQKTLHHHLSLLKQQQHREIYKLMSNTIKATYGKKL